MKITVEKLVMADIDKVWNAWNNPEDIKQWNSASDDWHTTDSKVDLREGGKFSSRMEAKDGSAGFDFEGIYTRVEEPKLIEYKLTDDREVKVTFDERDGGVLVTESFDAESQNSAEIQRGGWQAILDNFAKHVESKGGARSATQ